jgi:hypothetical protein
MTNLEALDRYADVLHLTSEERTLFYMVSSGFKVKDSAEAVWMSPSQGSRTYHAVRRSLDAAIRVEKWVRAQATQPTAKPGAESEAR